MSEACETCAFGKAGGAADEPLNRLKAAIAAVAGFPFWCHHARSGDEYDWRAGALGCMALPPNQRKVCDGWKRQVAELARSGQVHLGKPEDHALLRRYQRQLGREAFVALDAFCAEDGPEKLTAKRRLESLIEALHVHKSYELEALP